MIRAYSPPKRGKTRTWEDELGRAGANRGTDERVSPLESPSAVVRAEAPDSVGMVKCPLDL
jgi:hypothetical protein